MTNHGTRYRLVTTQNGNEHISSVVLTQTEATDLLDVEEMLLRRSDWKISHAGGKLIAQKLNMGKHIRRTIQVRAYTPLEDTTPNLGEPLTRQT